MPDDYYVSQYSGEEIDALLGIAGAGAVRYDAAQTLTDAQKKQARGNIDAAPGGFGLGTSCVHIGTQDLDTITNNGWYQFGEDNQTAPVNAGNLFVIKRTTTGYCTQVVFNAGVFNPSLLIRQQAEGAWSPWEYQNPPMQLGVEYRTTERYLGKPVYKKLVRVESVPAGDTTVQISAEPAEYQSIVSADTYSTIPAQYNSQRVVYISEARCTNSGVTVTLTNSKNQTFANYDVLVAYTKS